MTPANTAPPNASAARSLASSLAWLRLCAIAGQAATVLWVAHVLRLPIPEGPLFAGIGVLAAFAGFALWRLRQPWPVTTVEAVVHIVVDTVVLGWLLYLTGGASNPFVSLLLMPITLAAAALGLGAVALIAGLSSTTYILLMLWSVPLPSLGGHADISDFGLHVIGMAVSYAISAAMLGWFIGQLAATLRTHQAEVQRIRERGLRDEGILAIATHAASAAHALNTPLSTVRTLLGELRREHPDGPLGEDLALMDSQIERCRESLRELVAVGKAQLSQSTERLSLEAFVAGCLDQFRLLRPETDLDLTIDAEVATLALAVPAGLRHALLNLLNNAAEASLGNGTSRIALTVRLGPGALEFRMRDHGAGIAPATLARLGIAFASSKSTGLGIGFALAHATAERLGGTLELHPAEQGGAETVLAIPLATLLA